MKDMGNHMDAVSHFAGLVYQDESVIVYLWPLRSNAMQIPSFGKEPTAHGVGRNDDLSFLMMLQEISQAACMIAMPMRNENIVHITEIYAQQLCVLDKHVTRSCIKQDLVLIRCQKDRKAVLCFKRRITRPVV